MSSRSRGRAASVLPFDVEDGAEAAWEVWRVATFCSGGGGVEHPAKNTAAEIAAKYRRGLTNPAKSRPPPTRHVTVTTGPFGRGCGRIGNSERSMPERMLGKCEEPVVPPFRFLRLATGW